MQIVEQLEQQLGREQSRLEAMLGHLQHIQAARGVGQPRSTGRGEDIKLGGGLIFTILGNFPKAFFLAVTSLKYFFLWQLSNCAIFPLVASQICPSRSARSPIATCGAS